MGHIGKSKARRWICGFLILFIVAIAFAQEALSPSELLKESSRLIDAKKYTEAIVAMNMYLELVEPSTAYRVIERAQDIRFKLARLLIEQQRLEEASEVLEKYVNLLPCKFPRQGMKMLATCYYEVGKPKSTSERADPVAFKKCIEAVENALEYNENPIVIAKSIALDDKQGDGVLTTANQDEEPEYTPVELVLLYLTLGEAHFGIEHWTESIEPFTYVIENTKDEQRKGYAIMQVVNALINIPDFGRIKDWIPQLYRTDARYDIRVNLALMNAASALYEAEEYDSALPLYRMILPRDEVLAYQRERLRLLRLEAGMTPEEGMEVSENEMLLFGPGDSAETTETGEEAASEPETEDSKEVRELEQLITALEGLPAYENNIDYRIAQLYQQVERYWESVQFLDSVYTLDPDGDLGQRAIVDAVTILIEDLDELEEARTRGYAFMDQHKDGTVPRRIAYIFTSHYRKTKANEDTKTLLPYIDGFVRTNDVSVTRFDSELYFMQAVADLQLFNFVGSEMGFKRVLDEFPGSEPEHHALYWYGASILYQQRYAEALSIFEQYITKFPEGSYIDEAYYQGGVSLFGMEEYVKARERFTLVIDTFPDSTIYPSACSMRGDLYGADGLLDDAIADYKRAIAAAEALGDVKPATYAIFKMAEVYEADAEAYEDDEEVAQEKYNALVECVQSYLDTWGAEADIAKALFWIGKTKIQQGLADEAVETYLGAIVRFGTDVQQDGVDMMIAEMVKVSSIWLNAEKQAKLIEDLLAALESTDNQVLQLRLRVTIAKLDYTEIELGKQLIKELPDLKNASPPILAAICDASFEMKDYSRAKELLDLFVSRFEDSDYKRAAYKLRAFGQYAEGDIDGALVTIEEAQETYGHDRDVVWAQLMLAKILYDQGKLDEAREANMYVRNTPEWRGEPVAQAMYQLGQIEEKAGNTRKAFGFYQRTYVQYRGYAGGLWAAESFLASARCLKTLGLEQERIETYRAMLYDSYVNELPQAEVARKELGSGDVAEIETFLAGGGTTNIVIDVAIGDMVDTTLSKVETGKPAAAAEAEESEVMGEANTIETEMDMEGASESETNEMDAVEMGGVS